MIDYDIKLGYDDVALVQSISGLDSRDIPNTHYSHESCYPIFISPMIQLIDDNNVDKFESAGLLPIIHRGKSLSFMRRWGLSRTHWTSFSVAELEDFLNTESLPRERRRRILHKVCIDTPNGTMPRLYKLVQDLKSRYNCIIMAGNIGIPEAIIDAMKVGIDYVRVGIGGGCQCTTSIKTGIHYPPVSLLKEMRDLRDSFYKENPNVLYTKLVADGGVNEFGKIYKALAAGADYVMIGTMAASIYECCGDIEKEACERSYRFDSFSQSVIMTDQVMFRKFYGMSTKKAQSDMGKKILVPSEGTESKVEILYNLDTFTEALSFSMRSSMSYLGISNIEDFYKCKLIRVSSTAFDNYRQNKKILW